MADKIPPRDWFTPKLETLLAEADTAGYARDVSVAIITDLINGALGVFVPPASEDNPNQDIGEPDYMTGEQSGAHPSLPVEPGDTGIGFPVGHVGGSRHW